MSQLSDEKEQFKRKIASEIMSKSVLFAFYVFISISAQPIAIKSVLPGNLYLTMSGDKFVFQIPQAKDLSLSKDQIAVLQRHMSGFEIMFNKKSLYVTDYTDHIDAKLFDREDPRFLWILEPVGENYYLVNKQGCLAIGNFIGPLEGFGVYNRECDGDVANMVSIIMLDDASIEEYSIEMKALK